MQQFDSYQAWLDIPPAQQPPTYYRLFALRPFESDAAAIEAAANRTIARVEANRAGPYRIECEQLLTQLQTAKVTLTDPSQKARYDSQIQNGTGAVGGEQQIKSAPPVPNMSNASGGAGQDRQITSPPPPVPGQGLPGQSDSPLLKSAPPVPGAGPAQAANQELQPLNSPPPPGSAKGDSRMPSAPAVPTGASGDSALPSPTLPIPSQGPGAPDLPPSTQQPYAAPPTYQQPGQQPNYGEHSYGQSAAPQQYPTQPNAAAPTAHYPNYGYGVPAAVPNQPANLPPHTPPTSPPTSPPSGDGKPPEWAPGKRSGRIGKSVANVVDGQSPAGNKTSTAKDLKRRSRANSANVVVIIFAVAIMVLLGFVIMLMISLSS